MARLGLTFSASWLLFWSMFLSWGNKYGESLCKCVKKKMGTEYAVKLAGNRESKINVCLLQGTKAQCHNV